MAVSVDGTFSDKCEITIKCDTLLELEQVAFQLLTDVRNTLSDTYSAKDDETVREVLQMRLIDPDYKMECDNAGA